VRVVSDELEQPVWSDGGHLFHWVHEGGRARLDSSKTSVLVWFGVYFPGAGGDEGRPFFPEDGKGLHVDVVIGRK
jgi:hypothetical protein